MSVRVRVVVDCDQKDCKECVETTGKITAAIESGGQIEVDLDPALPESWSWSRWGGYRCGEHRYP